MIKCKHCGGFLTDRIKPPATCVLCGREERHYQAGPKICKDCVPRPHKNIDMYCYVRVN